MNTEWELDLTWPARFPPSGIGTETEKQGQLYFFTGLKKQGEKSLHGQSEKVDVHRNLR